MTVQELLKSVDETEFIQEYLRNDGQTIEMLLDPQYTFEQKEQMLNRFKTALSKSLNALREMPVEPQDEFIVFAVPYNEDGCGGWHSYMCKREEIENHENIERVETYGYEFDTFENVLSYDVSKTCLYMHDELFVAVAIYDEMTFFGIDVEKRNEKVEEESEKIEESLKECEEHNFENCRPIQELFDELGWKDERTEKEKEFDHKKIHIDGEHNMKTNKLVVEMECHYLSLAKERNVNIKEQTNINE